MTRIQTLEVKNNLPVVIETPVGLITIRRIDKRFAIEVPECLRAHRGKMRAMEHARFLEEREDGTFIPLHPVLHVVVDDTGAVQDLLPVRRARIGL